MDSFEFFFLSLNNRSTPFWVRGKKRSSSTNTPVPCLLLTAVKAVPPLHARPRGAENRSMSLKFLSKASCPHLSTILPVLGLGEVSGNENLTPWPRSQFRSLLKGLIRLCSKSALPIHAPSLAVRGQEAGEGRRTGVYGHRLSHKSHRTRSNHRIILSRPDPTAHKNLRARNTQCAQMGPRGLWNRRWEPRCL